MEGILNLGGPGIIDQNSVTRAANYPEIRDCSPPLPIAVLFA
jgi:hypothetical protein